MLRFGLPVFTPSDNPVPEKIVGYLSVQGKESVFGSQSKGLHTTAKAYHATKRDRDAVRRDLEKSGFDILAESALGVSVFAAAEQFEELTGGTVQPTEKLMYTTNAVREYITCLDIVGDGYPLKAGQLGVGQVR
jgi:hypothetical protein